MTLADQYARDFKEWRIIENWTGTTRMASAALLIHKPHQADNGVVCAECGTAWPCRTYTAMEKEAH